MSFVFFFFNAPATTEIYTLSLHDALPISLELGEADLARFLSSLAVEKGVSASTQNQALAALLFLDRKSTRLNSSHTVISYAVFCLKKKKKKKTKEHNTS